MGNKAKAAIKTAQTSIGKVNTILGDVGGNFQGIFNTKSLKKETLEKFIDHCKKKHPGVTDFTPLYKTDATIKAYVDDIAKKKQSIKDYKTSCKVALNLLNNEMANARKAMDELNKLITAKATKKSSAKGLAKVAAKLKTKSLGDLRKTKDDLDKVLAQANRETLGIKAYFEKVGG